MERTVPMFLAKLLLVFVALPAALVILTALLPPTGQLWVSFVAFPLGLILFALWRHCADRGEGGAA